MIASLANTFSNCFKIPELKSRIIFTVVILAICRLAAVIHLPGLDGARLAEFFEEQSKNSNSIFGLYSMFSGGALQNCAIGALGIMPYISATIIVQLLTAVYPPWSKLAREDGGRTKLIQYGRYLTVLLCVVQGTVTAIGWEHPESVFGQGIGRLLLYSDAYLWWYRVQTVLILTAGTMLLMWLGEQITDRGIGNGVSLIITVNILSSLPSAMLGVRDMFFATQGVEAQWNRGNIVVLLALLLVVIAGVIAITQAQRKIPVQYAQRAVGRKVYSGGTSFMPLRVNYSGVMPIIFAQAILMFTAKDGLPEEFDWVDVFPSFHGILFSTNKGIYKFNYSNNEFEADTLLGFDFSHDNNYVYPLIEDYEKNIWYSSVHEGQYERETGVLKFQGTNKKYIAYYKPFTQLREYAIETIYPEKSGVVWFGSSDALIKYSGKKINEKSKKFNCLIRSITIHNDSVIHIRAGLDEKTETTEINFSDKTIRFDFTALSYNTFGHNEYQVMLVGFDDRWSDWNKETFKEYTSLVENEYEFKVRSKDVFGNISKEASIKFVVSPPFYRTWYAFIIYIIVFAAIIYLILKLNELRHAKERYSLEKLVEDRTNELAYQKEQTEQLVKKLLPQNAADEIRETGKAKSQKYDMVTVLFADIQGFTAIAERTKPEDLIKHLNNIFISFDKIIANYNIEKIKTIGDAYMCAGGMPNKDNTNPVEVVMAALEMQREIGHINEKSTLKLELRIGVHSGPVVAGVVGSKKLEYDIWGDTVNIASRMESHGLINKVNISEQTYNMVKDFFVCQYRGKIEVKYKGEMEMYFVHEIKKVLSENSDRITPNKDFFIKLQFIRFKIIQEDILDQLQRNLPSNLYYHNLKHTINVMYIVENIAREEGVDEEEMLLLKCAALFHDAGFMVSYDNNEEIGAKMAAQTLQKYKFNEVQIETVKRLIMATKMPPRPKDQLEKIICDADLDYLGRPDFIPISQNLFRELFERGKINTIEQWNKMQYKFMLSHNYFTATARKNRDVGKQAVLKELKEMV